MKITLQKLQDKNACKEGIEYFNKYYPNGVEVIDILKNPKVSTEFLHWGHLHLDLTEEEERLYYERMHIVDSNYITKSYNVTSSQYVHQSSNIIDSKFISNSQDIETATQVYNSSMVEHSQFINQSIGISNSELILTSNNIDNCKNISNGSFLSEVYCARFCNSCSNSAFIEHCNSIDNSYFNLFCENSSNLIFCFGLQNTNNNEYYIFNTKVSKSNFEIAKKQINKLIKKISWKLLEFKWDETALNFDNNYIKLHKDLFTKQDIDFIKNTAKTFIGYNEKIFNLIIG